MIMLHLKRILVVLLIGLWVSPAWCQDDKIIFTSKRTGESEIFAMNVDGSAQTNLSNTPSVAEDFASWRPDGNRIVYQRTDDIWTMKPDGSDQQRIPVGHIPMMPDYDPTGQKITFSAFGGYDHDVYVMPADGSAKTRLANNPLGDYYARWNPSGTKISFHTFNSFGGDYLPDIYVMNPDGSGQTRLTFKGRNENADWSPDGTKIVFQSYRDGDYEIYLMNADGSGETALTANAFDEALPTFSPDGKKIAFVSNRSGNEDIYVMNADGSSGNDPVRLTTDPASDTAPSWGQTNLPPTPTPTPTPPTPLPSCVTPPGGAVSWWGAEGNAVDRVSGNNGTLFNGATFAPGKVGQAFRFDGVDDRISVPDADNLKITGSLTIEAWINVASASRSGMIFFRGDSRIGLDPYVLTIEPGGILQFLISSQTDYKYLTTGTGLSLSQWHHVAAVFNDVTGVMQLYVDGALSSQTTTIAKPFRDLDPNQYPGLGIGNHSGYPGTPYNYPYHGLIDELTIYNRALTATEIQSIYNAGSEGKCTSTPTPTPQTAVAITAINKPGDFAVVTGLNAIAGRATDSATGIERVDLFIQRRSDKKFWSGISWTTTSIALSTAYTASTGIWVRRSELPLGSNLLDGGYFITAKARSRSGNTASVVASVHVDRQAPLVAFSRPTHGQIILGLPIIECVAADVGAGSGVARVELFIQRKSDGRFWSGTSWVTYSVALSTQYSATTKRWTRQSNLPSTSQLPSGAYLLSAKAYDRAGFVGRQTIAVQIGSTLTAGV